MEKTAFEWFVWSQRIVNDTRHVAYANEILNKGADIPQITRDMRSVLNVLLTEYETLRRKWTSKDWEMYRDRLVDNNHLVLLPFNKPQLMGPNTVIFIQQYKGIVQKEMAKIADVIGIDFNRLVEQCKAQDYFPAQLRDTFHRKPLQIFFQEEPYMHNSGSNAKATYIFLHAVAMYSTEIRNALSTLRPRLMKPAMTGVPEFRKKKYDFDVAEE